MHKILVVILREYRAAVQTKAFLFSLLMVPIIGAVAIGVQFMIARSAGDKTLPYAIIDRTGELRPAIEAALKTHNEVEGLDPVTKARTQPSFVVEFVAPSPDEPGAIVQQRVALSERHARGEIEGFLEIGPDVYTAVDEGAPPDDRHSVRYQSEKEIERDFVRWAGRTVTAAVQERRFTMQGIAPDVVRMLQARIPQQIKGATRKNPTTGEIEDATEESKIASSVLPAVLVMLMFFMVLLGAVPAMQSVVEEKQQRIAEVLLGSVPPFQLMLGKLLGLVLVTLTISIVYLGGGLVVANRFGLVLPAALLAWFLVFLVLATLIYGSLFTAIGAAATDLKDTQSLQMPATMLLTMPTLLLSAVLRDPNGTVAVVASFFPFSAPLIMTARISATKGVPWWQPPLAAAEVLVLALACVWAAGRIFRIGLLMQGKRVRLRDLARWVVRG